MREELRYEKGWWRWELWSGLHGGRWTVIAYGHRVLYEDAAAECSQRRAIELAGGN